MRTNQGAILFAANLTFSFVPFLFLRINLVCLFPGGLCLWLVLWLVVVKPGGVGACPRLCVCYPTPMTVSCQSQNLTIVPAGVPFDSQRVFLQNNRITELRADSFGFETQVTMVLQQYLQTFLKVCPFSSLLTLFSPHSLQVLWLYGNNITWIEAGAFSNLRVLEELDLGDNPLQRLEGGAFRGLEKLQSLHMHRCKLAALPHDLFHKLYSLQFLYLQVYPACTHSPKNTHMQRYIFDSHARVCTRDTCRNTHLGEMLYRHIIITIQLPKYNHCGTPTHTR